MKENEGSVGYWTTRGCSSGGFPLCGNMGVFDHAKFTVPLQNVECSNAM